MMVADPVPFAFEEMLKDSNCRTMLTLTDITHASFAFFRTGMHGDAFKIGVLLFQNDAHFDKVAVQTTGYASSESGSIIIGKMLNSTKKPVAVVLNRTVQGVPMTVVGPNRIYYDSLNGEEFKVHVPSGYCN